MDHSAPAPAFGLVVVGASVRGGSVTGGSVSGGAVVLTGAVVVVLVVLEVLVVVVVGSDELVAGATVDFDEDRVAANATAATVTTATTVRPKSTCRFVILPSSPHMGRP
jgi:hypothetical protein